MGARRVAVGDAELEVSDWGSGDPVVFLPTALRTDRPYFPWPPLDESIAGMVRRLVGLLKGAALTLDDATLDRIDQIVPPGTNLYHPDGAWRPPALSDAARRRRPLTDRAAA